MEEQLVKQTIAQSFGKLGFKIWPKTFHPNAQNMPNNKALNESLTMAFICSFGKFGSKILAKTLLPKITKRRILVTRQALQDQPMQTNLDPWF